MNAIRLFFVFAALLVAVPVFANQQAVVHVSKNHISMKLPFHSGPTQELFTFGTETSVHDFLHSAAMSPMGTECSLTIHQDGHTASAAPASARLAAVITTYAHLQTGKSHSRLLLRCQKSNKPVAVELVLAEIKERRHAPFDVDMMSKPDFIEASRVYAQKRAAEEREYPFLPGDVIADGIEQALFWGWTFLTHHWGPLHPFQTYENTNETGIYDLNTGTPLQYTGQKVAGRKDGSVIKMSMSADWGSGTRESDYVSKLMVKDFDPHFTVHIGDVYLMGTIDEVQSNALGIPPPNVQKGVLFPHGSLGTFAINGNHETFSRCYGYYDYWLPTIGVRDPVSGQNQGQKASYFMLENEYWRVIALDTGYNTYSIFIDSDNNTQPQPVIDWLQNVVKISDPNDTRGILFLSHHQYVSAFDNPSDATPKQIQSMIPEGRTVLWLFGHEHRLAFYNLTDARDVNISAYCRCIGVGGFPVSLGPVPPNPRDSGLLAYDDRAYQMVEGLFNQTVGYNGFAQLSFEDNNLAISYYSLELGPDGKVSNTTSSLLLQETFSVVENGDVEMTSFNVINKNITVVQHL